MVAQPAHCEICYLNFPINQFRVLRCGHCFCENCVEKLKTIKGIKKPTCPQCRRPIHADDTRLFLSLCEPADAIKKQVKRSVGVLNRLDEGTKTEAVEHVGEYLRKVADNIQEEGGVVEALIHAISSFKERIIPVYETLESQKATIASQAAKIESKRNEIRDLRHLGGSYQAKVKAAEESRENAITLAEAAKNETVKLREELALLKEERKRDAEKFEDSRRNEEDAKTYKDHCVSYKRRESANKAKMKGLQDENKTLKRKLAQLQSHGGDVEGSLRIGDESQFVDYDSDELDDIDEKENASIDFHDNYADGPSTSASHRRPYQSKASYNRNPLRDRPPVTIRDNDIDLDLEFEAFPPIKGFRSDWNLPNPKKRKAEPQDTKIKGRSGGKGTTFPLVLDEKGHVKGTVQLATRTRMGKRG